ncbi:MAG: PilZ domain-containing protein [Kofleriaceae bacterium]
MGSERRRSQRLASSGELHVLARDRWRQGWLLDVSSHGARFCGMDLPPEGTRVRVQLCVPCHRLQLAGVVVRTSALRTELSAAINFDPLTRAQQVTLNNALLELGHPHPHPHADNGSILLMSDDPDTQLAVGKSLLASGYSLVARTTPLDVVQHFLESARPPLRAAIVSPTLPRHAGQDVLDFLAYEQPEVKRGLVVDDEQFAGLELPACGVDFLVVRKYDDQAALDLPRLCQRGGLVSRWS